MMKLWNGKYLDEEDLIADEFCASIGFDQRLWKEDILCSIAHVKKLAAEGKLTEDECDSIVVHLQEILWDAEAGRLHFTAEDHNIQTAVQKLLTRRIGEIAQKIQLERDPAIHTARALRLYQKEAIQELYGCLDQLIAALQSLAVLPKEMLPGQDPMTFLALADSLTQDKARFADCEKRTLVDEEAVSADVQVAVCDTAFASEFLSACASSMAHLAAFCDGLVLVSHFDAPSQKIALTDATLHICRLISNKTSRVTGDLMSVLTTSGSYTVSAAAKLQETCQPLFDGYDSLKSTLKVLRSILQSMADKAGGAEQSA